MVRRDHGGLSCPSVLGRRHGALACRKGVARVLAIDCAIDVAGVVPALESCLANGSDRAVVAAEMTKRKNSSDVKRNVKIYERRNGCKD